MRFDVRVASEYWYSDGLQTETGWHKRFDVDVDDKNSYSDDEQLVRSWQVLVESCKYWLQSQFGNVVVNTVVVEVLVMTVVGGVVVAETQPYPLTSRI